jgi:hypothetical protein
MGTTAGYIEIDVTNTVKAEAAGDDLVTFGLTTSLDTWSAFNSRENASNKPATRGDLHGRGPPKLRPG